MQEALRRPGRTERPDNLYVEIANWQSPFEIARPSARHRGAAAALQPWCGNC